MDRATFQLIAEFQMTVHEFPIDLKSLNDIFSFIEDFLRENHIPQSVGSSLKLAADELFTNIIRHQPDAEGNAVISIWGQEGAVLLTLKVIGGGDFDPRKVPDPDLNPSPAAMKPGGLGVYLVRRAVDDLKYEYDAEKRESKITIVKFLE